MSNRIDIDDDDVDMDVEGRLFYHGAPYSGEVVEYRENIVIHLDQYVDGRLHGLRRAWYSNGTLKGEEMCRYGRPSGEQKEWHPNGQLAHRQIFTSESGKLVAEYHWDEEGRVTSSWVASEG
ncbi:toxin-antitoxin system YwqK family antitoxin [Streptomyces zagrosensis]|uniref:Antitoxin component YwqK of YwqJK toxin-antitoxin module n=1 Tax=Streptomyces zagrosensis TaxID=1042984 RepID=A0A7W9Q5F4_9ACTN|nr:hypothetical protein [Streptomyces zagrosensis]MBB5933926.1 antitoxin component YwqK of YwqJK toxin-antitoxin module [Streptomyces zagrosensis]